MSIFVRRMPTHWSGPTVLAVLLALLSLPLVAISLDAVQAPPGVRAMNCGGGLIDSREPCIYDGLPLADLGRWSAAAGAVVAAALVAGAIGGLMVRRHAKMGGLLTVLLAWEVAIAAIPVLPAMFHLDVALAHAEGWMPLIRSTEPTSGLHAAGWVLISPLYEPVPLALLLVGVVVWTKLLRRFPVSRSQGTPEAEADIRPPDDDPGRSSKFASASPMLPSHADPELEALLPDSIGGVALMKSSISGEQMGLTDADPLLSRFGKHPADLASATATLSNPPLFVGVERLRGVPADQLLAAMIQALPSGNTASRTSLGGHQVTYMAAGWTPIWYYATGELLYGVAGAEQDVAKVLAILR